MRIDKHMRWRNNFLISEGNRNPVEIEKFSAVSLLPLEGIVQNFIEDGAGVRLTVPVGRTNFWSVVPIEGVRGK